MILKLMLIGALTLGGADHSHLISSFAPCSGESNHLGDAYRSTTITVGGESIQWDVWDANYLLDPRFATFSDRYLAGANAIMLVYDANDRVSFARIVEYLNLLTTQPAVQNIPIMLVGSVDSEAAASGRDRQVSLDEVRDVANTNHVLFAEITTADRTAMNNAFIRLTEEVYMRRTAPSGSIAPSAPSASIAPIAPTTTAGSFRCPPVAVPAALAAATAATVYLWGAPESCTIF